MADIVQEFKVKAAQERVFEMFATPKGLDAWWTKTSSGEPREGAEYTLFFGPAHDWRAKVTRCIPGWAFELLITGADDDWRNTRVGCELQPDHNDATRVRFQHIGWAQANEHWRVSCYCWAMYLRLLRRHLEYGEFVPYEKRLEA
jgi:uncharacterized protein YndB with AHSA1/START domain